MANPNIVWLLREIAKEQEYEEAYLLGRIDLLESLVRDIWEFGFSSKSGANSIDEHHKRENDIRERIAALGIEVDE